MEINVNGVSITLTKEQLEEINKQVNKPKDWRHKLVNPDEEEFYQLAEMIDGSLGVRDCFRDEYHSREYAFKTEEQAKLLAKKCNLMIEMHNFANAMNDGWIPNWKSGDECKYGLAHFNGSVSIRIRGTYNDFVFGVVVKSEEIADQMLKEFGKRIKEIYNTQY